MAGSSMGPDVARIATRLSSAVKNGRGKVLRSAAMKAKTTQQREIARVAGGDMRLSGVGKSGAKVGVGFNLPGGSTPEAVLKATGPLHLVERDTSAHLITSRYASGSRASRSLIVGPVAGGRLGGGGRAVVKIPGSDTGFRRYARHPGTSGQEPWAKGRKKAEPIIRDAMRKETRAIISAAR